MGGVGIHKNCDGNLASPRHTALPPFAAVIARVWSVLGCESDVCPERNVSARSYTPQEIEYRVDVAHARRTLKPQVKNQPPGRKDFPYVVRERSKKQPVAETGWVAYSDNRGAIGERLAGPPRWNEIFLSNDACGWRLGKRLRVPEGIQDCHGVVRRRGTENRI
jgi:hypothetical protein